MLTYIKLKFGGYIPYHDHLEELTYFHKLLGSVGSKLFCNDLKHVIFQKYRHFEKIDYNFCLIPKE